MNNININVFGYEKREPYPVHISKDKFHDMLSLLLITKGEKQHYVLHNNQWCTVYKNA